MGKLEILCVTMHQKDFSKIQQMNIHSDVFFANQADTTAFEELEFEGHTARMLTTDTRGVGINRNLALTYARGEICLFADDDVTYSDDMEEKVVSEFEKHPDADIMVFHFAANDPTRIPRQYPKTKKWPRYARMPWGAIRIAVRLKSLRKANVWFTTLFGGGCMFPSGEDSLWLSSARRNKLSVYVSKETIGTVSYEESCWFTGFDEKYFYGQGAFYRAMRPKTFPVWLAYSVWRTRKEKALSVKEKIHWIRAGKQGYQKMISYTQYKSSNS